MAEIQLAAAPGHEAKPAAAAESAKDGAALARPPKTKSRLGLC